MKKARQILALFLTILMTACSVDIIALADEMPSIDIQTEWTEPLESSSEDGDVLNSEQADDDTSNMPGIGQAAVDDDNMPETEQVIIDASKSDEDNISDIEITEDTSESDVPDSAGGIPDTEQPMEDASDDAAGSVSSNDAMAGGMPSDNIQDGSPDDAEQDSFDVPQDVPDVVQEFLDAVAAIPEITLENVLDMSEYVYGEVSEKYGALLGTEYEDREDVQVAMEKYAAAIETIDKMLDMESHHYMDYISGHTPSDRFYANGEEVMLLYTGIYPNNPKYRYDNPASNISILVGDTGSFQYLCTFGSTCNCGTVLVDEPPDWIAVDTNQKFTDSNPGIIKGKPTWCLSGYVEEDSADAGYGGYPCPQINIIGAKPGDTELKFQVYQNYWYEYYWVTCPNCDRVWPKISFYGSWIEDTETLDVKVIARYEIDYNLNGGNGAIPPTYTDTSAIQSVLNITSQEPADWMDDDGVTWTFAGWGLTPDAKESEKVDSIVLDWEQDGKGINPGSKDNPVQKTVYAIWKEAHRIPTLTKTPSDEYPYLGDEFYFEITADNKNSFEIVGTVTDRLDDGLDFVNAVDGGIYNPETRTITWDGVHVPANGNKTVKLYVKANRIGKIPNHTDFMSEYGDSGADAEVTITKGPAECAVVHEYYTDGQKDGRFSGDKLSGTDGDVIQVSDIGKIFKRDDNTYSFTWANIGIKADNSEEYIIGDIVTSVELTHNKDKIVVLRYDKRTQTTWSVKREYYLGNEFIASSTGFGGTGTIGDTMDLSGLHDEHPEWDYWRTYEGRRKYVYSGIDRSSMVLDEDPENNMAVIRYDAPTYTVTYTDGIPGEYVFPDEGYEGLWEFDDTPSDTSNHGQPMEEGDVMVKDDGTKIIFQGWSPVVNPVVSSDDDPDGDYEIVYTATWKAHEHKYETVTEPDCIHEGLKKCSCGDEQPIAALGHDFDGVEWRDDTDTGEHAEGCGSVIHVRDCKRCHGNLDGGTEASIHRLLDWKRLKEPTCTEDGLEERGCMDCGHKEARPLDMLGHDMAEDPSADPDCIHEGLTAGRHCDRCGYVEAKQEIVPALGHDFEGLSWMDGDGHTDSCRSTEHMMSCKRCMGGLEGGRLSEAHVYGEWAVVKEPTETEEGSRERRCLKCGHMETEPLAKKPGKPAEPDEPVIPETPAEPEKPIVPEQPAKPEDPYLYDIPDDETPLANVPQTGDGIFWILPMFLSGLGVLMKRRKR